jgi:thymidine kinase
MPNFTFKFAAMGATKTRDLLAVDYNFRVDCGLKSFVIKPFLDDRDGYDIIKSRDGGERKADLVVHNETDIFEVVKEVMPNIVLVDEVQFMNKQHIIQLRRVVNELEIPVIAYGLKNDFLNEMFEGAKYALIYADEPIQIKTLCRECKKKSATMNVRYVDGVPIFEGEQIQTGGDESYKAVCSKCYFELEKIYKKGLSK